MRRFIRDIEPIETSPNGTFLGGEALLFCAGRRLVLMEQSAVTLLIILMFMTSAMIAVGAVYTAR
jgi:hypothetical protein